MTGQARITIAGCQVMRNKANLLPGAGDCGLGIAECGLKSRRAPRHGPGGKCGRAKQSQVAGDRLETAGRSGLDARLCETKPIWGGRQGPDALATNALRRHYERGRFCETKPVCREKAVGWKRLGG
jgi:hypothetical protein